MSNSLQPHGEGSSVHGISQARIQECVVIRFSRDIPGPGIESKSPALLVDSLPSEPPEYFTLWSDGGSDSKEFAYNVGDPGLLPGLRRSPGDGNGYPLQYSCLENSMDRAA